MYPILKDFLQPVATTLVAIAAAVITAIFSYRQSKTAKLQADIAHDKLRLDMFDRRYKIYEAARHAIEIAVDSEDENAEASQLEQIFLLFEESRFFFPPETYSFLHELRGEIRQCIRRRLAKKRRLQPPPFAREEDVYAAELKEEEKILQLREQLYVTKLRLPAIFQTTLAFPQLVSSPSSATKSRYFSLFRRADNKTRR